MDGATAPKGAEAIVRCDECRSGDLRHVPLLYEAGVSYVDATTTGSALGRTGVSIGVARTRGMKTTALSARLAPPRAKGWVGRLLLALSLAIVAMSAGWYVLLILSFVFAASAIEAKRYTEQQFPQQMDRWSRSFMCRRCGWIGIPELPAAVSRGPGLSPGFEQRRRL
jgi:hypothetical protein